MSSLSAVRVLSAETAAMTAGVDVTTGGADATTAAMTAGVTAVTTADAMTVARTAGQGGRSDRETMLLRPGLRRQTSRISSSSRNVDINIKGDDLFGHLLF